MVTKTLEQIVERMRHWPERRQADAAEVLLEMERQDSSACALTDAQVREVARMQRDIRDGNDLLASDEEMADLWRACGL